MADAAAALEERQLDAAWGSLHCKITGYGANTLNPKMNRRGHPLNAWRPAVSGSSRYALMNQLNVDTWVGNKEEHATVWAAEHVLATHLFVKSTPRNRAIAVRWLAMATETPEAFCAANQDQTALAILHHNEHLPRIDLCGPFNVSDGPVESRNTFMRARSQKSIRVFIDALATQAFEVHKSPWNLEQP